MKRINCFLFMFLFISAILFQGCEKDDAVNGTDELTSQVQKVETEYQVGDVKTEYLYIDGTAKDETVADETVLAAVEKASQERLYKNTVRLKYAGYNAAVFKSGSCQTAVLDIIMDSEDKNCKSQIIGWSGDSYRDGNGNIWLRFCACNLNQFTNHRTKGYAILQIDWADLDYVNIQQLERYFDNEDNKNANAAAWNGDYTKIKNTSNIYPSFVGSNTDLFFYYFPPKSWGVTTFPTAGIANDYGVLGDMNGDKHGYIYSDDEDKRNANYLKLNNVKIEPLGLSSILEGGSNTKLYITQVLNGVPQL